MAFAEKYGQLAPPSVRASVEDAGPPARIRLRSPLLSPTEISRRPRLGSFCVKSPPSCDHHCHSHHLAHCVPLVDGAFLLTPRLPEVKLLLIVVGVLAPGGCAAIWEFYGGNR